MAWKKERYVGFYSEKSRVGLPFLGPVFCTEPLHLGCGTSARSYSKGKGANAPH